MKKIYTFFIVLILTGSVFAQSPGKISYQAVIRDASNQLVINNPVGMQISILQGSANGNSVYEETHRPTTNANGLVTFEIGAGITMDNFSAIDWSNGIYFIKTEADPLGGSNYSITGTSQLMSVPYALYALSSGSSLPGPQGFKGDMGDQGLQGEAGQMGPKGEQGIQGDVGQIGPKGDIGETGLKGDIGETGAKGDQGIAGDDGALNAWGLEGSAGTVGGTNFIGTTDNQYLSLRTNNMEKLRITTKGQLETVNTGHSVFMGESAGANDDLNDHFNVFIGYQTGYSNISGDKNTAVGPFALNNNTIGSENAAFGTHALLSNTEGNYNTAIGSYTLYANLTGTNNTAIGYSAMYGNTTGTDNTATGFNALATNTTGSYNTAFGNSTLIANTTGNYNTASGYYALGANTEGHSNTAAGFTALSSNTTGNTNTATGFGALQYNTEGSENSAYGSYALRYNSTGTQNTASGYYALFHTTVGRSNSSFGYGSMVENTEGKENTAMGFSALMNNNTGENNTALGVQTLFSTTTGSNNTAVGKNALYTNIDGSNNVAIGFKADVSSASLTNATAIGYNAKVASSNSLVLGATGADAVMVGIGTASPTANLEVRGTVKITDGTEADGKVLTSDADGNASWKTMDAVTQAYIDLLEARIAALEASRSIVSLTAEATDITATTATSGGNITQDGGASITERGVCWSTSVNPTIADSKTRDGSGKGSFTSLITGLSPETTYYLRSYATKMEGTTYGDEKSFTTPALTVPVVETLTTISHISASTAVGGGEVISDGFADITARGLCWSISSMPTILDNLTTDGIGVGSFSSSMSGLTAETSYFVRAYATNSIGTSYGEETTFTTTTMTLPVLTTSASVAGNLPETTILSGGDITNNGGGAITARGVCWSTSVSPTLANDNTLDGAGSGAFTSSITGLTAGTTYYLRAYATNNAGTSYGNEIRITTQDGTAPAPASIPKQ